MSSEEEAMERFEREFIRSVLAATALTVDKLIMEEPHGG